MRKYEKSHPWLKFSITQEEIPWEVWLLLGEARSKCQHICGVPLQPKLGEQMACAYLVKGAHATTAIEGNTLSEAEVRKILEGKLELPTSKKYLEREVSNMLEVFNRVMAEAVDGTDHDITPSVIKDYNRGVLNGLELIPDVVPGEIRNFNVTVGRYLGAPPEDCEFLLRRLCDWLNGAEFTAPRGNSKNLRIPFAIIKAILAHLNLAWIHPFGDGNGRTARLLEYQILIDAGMPSTSAHLLSNHYNETRTEYYRQLDYASRSGGDVSKFIAYATQGLVDGLANQLHIIRMQQWKVAWRDFVRELLPIETRADRRRRRLLLDLADEPKSVPKKKIRFISERLAEAYADKTMKTITRDLNTLVELDLIVQGPAGYRAKLERILQFLPAVKSDDEEPVLPAEELPSTAANSAGDLFSDEFEVASTHI